MAGERLGQILSGALPVVGGIINAISGAKANQTNLQIAREYNQTQKDIAEYQAQYNERMWNMQNEYNTPSAQMERYKAAGLNPNLIYGQGTPGNAQSAPSAPDIKQIAPEVRPVVQDGLGISQSISAMLTAQAMELDNKRRAMELEQVPYQTQLKQLEVFNEQIRQTLLMQQQTRNAKQLEYLDDQLFYQTQAAQQTVKNLVLKGDLMYQTLDLKDQANDRAWKAMSQRERQLAIQQALAQFKIYAGTRLLPGQEYQISQRNFLLEKENSIRAIEQKFQEEFGKDNANMFMKALGLAIQLVK